MKKRKLHSFPLFRIIQQLVDSIDIGALLTSAILLLIVFLMILEGIKLEALK